VAKRTSRNKKNHTMVVIVIIIAASGLLLSSVVAYLGSNNFVPGVDPSTNNQAYIADMQYQIGQLEDSLEKAPGNVYLLTQLGNSYYQLAVLYNATVDEEQTKASFAKALEPYGLALEIEPENVDVRVDRAVAAFWSDNLDLAEEEFDKAIEINPIHVKAYFNYGIFLLLGRNNAPRAIEQWSRVLELNPPNEQELVSLTRTWIAQAEQSMQELKGDPSQFEEDDEDGKEAE
jgi:tetratricopeptide (TPR) repeat protein